MATQLSRARAGEITKEMIEVAEDEGLAPEVIRERVAAGTVVIPKNVHHGFRAIGVGQGLRTKINANIGASGFHQLIHEELGKLEVLVRHGADSCMDLSTGDDIDRLRTELLPRCPVMLGTVPIYQAAAEGSILKLDPEHLFACIEKQAEQGVDFMTVHCGVTRASVQKLRGHD